MKSTLVVIALTAALLGLGAAVGQGLGDVFGAPVLVALAMLSLGINWLAFVPAALGKTDSFYDLTGSLSFLALAGAAAALGTGAAGISLLGALCAGAVVIWALRLGSFLFYRVRKTGGDPRFEVIKTRPLRFLVAWTLQAVWAFVTSLPVLIIVLSGAEVELGAAAALGLTLWVVGFVVEVVADAQKARFRRRAREGAWIDEGLWSLSQHPNYFGEILLWVGLFVCGVEVYDGLEWLSAASPCLVAVLLLKVSGVPMLRSRAAQRWGSDPDYMRYLNETNLLLPWPSSQHTSRRAKG